MKRFAALLLALTMALSLAACGGGDEPSIRDNIPIDTAGAGAAPTEPAPTQPPKTVFAAGILTSDSGSCTVEFVGAELFADDDGSQSLRIWFDFRNDTAETLSARDRISFFMDVRQNEQDLPQAHSPYGKEIPEEYNKNMPVRPGAVIRCVEQKKVDPGSGAVSVVLDADSAVTWELDLNDLPGAPAEALQTDAVADPGWTKPLPLEGIYEDSYYIRIDSAEVTTDTDGNRALRVFFEYTNNSDQDNDMWRIADLWAFQDGIGMDYVFPDSWTDTDERFEDDLAVGETWTVSRLFRLYSDSPLEVELIDDKGGTGLGAVFFPAPDGTVTMGSKEAQPEPTEPPTEAPTEAPTEPAASGMPPSFTEQFTISDSDNVTVTVHYPGSFSYEADYCGGSFLSERPYVYGGLLTGPEYTVDFALVQPNAYYKTTENYVRTFKGTDIYEEITVSGYTAYVRQDQNSRLNIVVCLTDTQMLMLEITVPGEGSAEDYRPIWEDGTLRAITEHLQISLESIEGQSVSTGSGYVSLTETDGWRRGDPKANGNLTLYKAAFGAAVWVDVQDPQLNSLQRTMEIISSGYPDAQWTDTTLAGYALKLLDCGSVQYLAGETSTGKGFHIEIRNIAPEEIAELLQTLVIH